MDQQTKLEREVAQVANEERRRIAFELHDMMSQVMTGLQLRFSAFKTRLPPENLPEAEEISDQLNDALAEYRVVLRGLHAPERISSDFMRAFSDLCALCERRFLIRCEFICCHVVSLPVEGTLKHLIFIAQEAVTNAVKHGKSKAVEILLEEEGSLIRLMIRDSGRGLDSDWRERTGSGMRVMRHRAESIGAKFTVENRSSCGVEVLVVLNSERKS